MVTDEKDYVFNFLFVDREILRDEGVRIRHPKLRNVWKVSDLLIAFSMLNNKEITSRSSFPMGSQLYSVPYHVSFSERFSEISLPTKKIRNRSGVRQSRQCLIALKSNYAG
jgi:hypothetical protein